MVLNRPLARGNSVSPTEKSAATLEALKPVVSTEITVKEINVEEINDHEATIIPEPDEDIIDDIGTFCNGCSCIFPNWNTGRLYLRVVRTDCDLCEDD